MQMHSSIFQSSARSPHSSAIILPRGPLNTHKTHVEILPSAQTNLKSSIHKSKIYTQTPKIISTGH